MQNLIRFGFVLGLFASPALAQLDNNWATFAPGTGRIKTSAGADATAILTDTQEKDFAAGDLNKDGWTDLVIVRKQPFTSGGHYPNFLLMNEGGILVDRSAQYASEADVAGDLGFLTPTNDRDVVIVDVNLDTWPDVVTATTLSTQPKHISHPRVYINKGSINGTWQGLRYEANRIPFMGTDLRFCGMDAGDVTGDGAPDLYFSDYGNLGDKLLINDGNGNFSDSGTTRIAFSMLDVLFGSAVRILDMNGDGHKDIVRSSGVTGSSGAGPIVSLAQNNPSQVGYFPTLLYSGSIGSGAPYHVDAGDLNRDNKPDIIVSDDGQDTFRLNTGNDSLGRVTWGPVKSFSYVTPGDDGFAGTNHIVDLDGDQWPDAILADVDVDIGGCDRRCHVYHNLGGTIGGDITMREEAGSAANGNWRGVKGMAAGDLTGTYDVATLDLDRDGDMDMVFGRCSGTFVWLNQKFTAPTVFTYSHGDTNPNSTGQKARISATGTPGSTANNFQLRAEGLPALKTTIFLYGAGRLWAPAVFGDGQRWVNGPIQRFSAVTSDASGVAIFNCNFNAAPMNTIPIGAERGAQAWFRDPAAGAGHSNTTDAELFWRVD